MYVSDKFSILVWELAWVQGIDCIPTISVYLAVRVNGVESLSQDLTSITWMSQLVLCNAMLNEYKEVALTITKGIFYTTLQISL